MLRILRVLRQTAANDATGRFNTNPGTRNPFGGFGFGPEGADSVNKTGGLPFYGNMYQGRVNPDDFRPPPPNHGERPSCLLQKPASYVDDDPVIRAQMDKCAYFALCDMTVWHKMDPSYLDPGLITDEEHHLLLLWSRAYYEKWKAINSKTREIAPHIRIKKGNFACTAMLLDHCRVPDTVQRRIQEALFDDSHLVALRSDLWSTAHMDDKLRDHFCGRTLLAAGVTASQLEELEATLKRMRTVAVHREDYVDPPPSMPVDQQVPFDQCVTLYDMHKHLGLVTYSGQLKVRNFFNAYGARMTVTLNDEDTFFDFKFHSFFNPNLTIASGSTSRYVVTVERKTRAQSAMGRWI